MQRRTFLQTAAAGSLLWTTPGLLAEQLTSTPRMTEGPFYPDKLPLDTDNDLLVINNSLTPAVGEITYLTGRVLDRNGEPVRNAFVEIWQCDSGGAYLHAGTGNMDKKDANFQGYGRFLTNSAGEYCFRTIKPVPYPGRTPHIHFGISRSGQRVLTTQLFIKGHPQNESDGVLRGIADTRQREAVLREFLTLPGSSIGELAVSFDIVLGQTPAEQTDANGKSIFGIAPSDRERGGGRMRPPRNDS